MSTVPCHLIELQPNMELHVCLLVVKDDADHSDGIFAIA
jgi:hypothetical protein